jgi:hypothetical protein
MKKEILKPNPDKLDEVAERFVQKEPSDEFFDAIEVTEGELAEADLVYEEKESPYTKPTRGLYHFPIAGWYSINYGEPKYYTPEDTIEMDDDANVSMTQPDEYWKK